MNPRLQPECALRERFSEGGRMFESVAGTGGHKQNVLVRISNDDGD
jgi:hypothetical protein